MPPFAKIQEPLPALAQRADVKKARATSGLKLVVVLGLLPNYSLLGQMSAFGGAKKETALLADSGELNIYLLAQCSGSTGQRSQRQAGVRIIQ